MDVCGVDPGLGTSGYAVLSLEGERPVVREAGISRPAAGAALSDRLRQIEHDFTRILEQWQPGVMGVEQIYAHYRHPRTAILMGHARGVILSVAARFGVVVRSYSATQVKRHLTGNGRASKSQMQRAIRMALKLRQLPEPNDVADALAVGLCCAADVRGSVLERAPA